MRGTSPRVTGVGEIAQSLCRNPAGPTVMGLARRILRGCTQQETPMKYMLLIYSNEASMLAANEETRGRTIAAYQAYTEAISKSGVLLGSNRLRPTGSATTVRAANGKTSVLDGPYAETKEQLAGYYMIDVPDLDAALAWASRCPGAAQGAVEVRPIWEM